MELKERITESLENEVIAFANTHGGVIYVGVADSGEVKGIESYDEECTSVASKLRDAIKPDLTMLVNYERIEAEGKTLLAIQVGEGTNKPYYLARNGLKPSGVFVRQGNACAQATDSAIRRMIKLTDGDAFESARSLQQDLRFESARRAFERRGLKLQPPQKQTLGLVSRDGLFTNLGLLLSDQCPATIKAAVFRGNNQRDFQDRREFKGSLLQQADDCYEYISLNNPISATFQGLYRQDHQAIPPEAVREALLNSVIHRDYGRSASTLVSIYSDRLELVSFGGLLKDVELKDVLMGSSVCRNKRLADVFYRLKLIEAYGTGLRKIQEAYRGQPVQPEILCSPNAFKVVLPRILPEVTGTKAPDDAQGHEEKVISALRAHAGLTRREIERICGLNQSAAGRLIRRMLQEGRLAKTGAGRSTRYVPGD